MEETKTRKPTRDFKFLLIYFAGAGAAFTLSNIFSWFPQASVQGWGMTIGLGVILTMKTKGHILVKKPEPFFDAKAAVEEFRNRPLPWERTK